MSHSYGYSYENYEDESLEESEDLEQIFQEIYVKENRRAREKEERARKVRGRITDWD